MGALVRNAQPVQRRASPQFAAGSTWAWRCRCAHSSIWLRTARPASPTATAAIRSRTSTSAASATTTSTHGRSSGTAKLYSLPGFGIDEVSGADVRAADGRVEPAAAASSNRVGRRASTSPGCARPCSRRRCGPTRGDTGARKDYASVGAQVDLRFSILHWYEMTLSAGYAVGFGGGQRAGAEWMISLQDHVSRAATRMTLDVLLPSLVGLLPVLGFLAALLYLDSYKLVKLRARRRARRRRRRGRRALLLRQRPACWTCRHRLAPLHPLRRARWSRSC